MYWIRKLIKSEENLWQLLIIEIIFTFNSFRLQIQSFHSPKRICYVPDNMLGMGVTKSHTIPFLEEDTVWQRDETFNKLNSLWIEVCSKTEGVTLSLDNDKLTFKSIGNKVINTSKIIHI